MPTMQERVAERYPSLIGLLRQPEIGKLLTTAVTENWSPGVFQSKFMASKWFKSQSEAQRRWWVTATTDPGEARVQRQLFEQELRTVASRLGFTPTRAEYASLRERALQLGVTPDSTWMVQALNNLAQRRGGRTGPGAWTTNAGAIRQLAESEYFRALPKHVVNKWTSWITTGMKTMEDLQASLQQEAIKANPHMAHQLTEGLTVNDIIGSQRELIAEELELSSPTQVDIKNPKWRKLLGVRDPKTKQMRLLTDSEALKMAREDPKWWNTSKGRQSDASMTTAIREMFGLRKM